MQPLSPAPRFGHTQARPPAATSARAATVRFGTAPLGNLLEVMGDQNKSTIPRRRKKGVITRLLGATSGLTLLLVGIFPGANMIRQGLNIAEGRPLESVLQSAPAEPLIDIPLIDTAPPQPTETVIPSPDGFEPPVILPPAASSTTSATDTPAVPKMSTRQLVDFLSNNNRLDVPASMLPAMAKAGLIQEVIVTNTVTREGFVVLINGRERQTKLDDKTQATLIDEYQVPVNKPFLSWLNLNALEATILSALLVGATAQVFNRRDKVHGKLTTEDKKRIEVNDLGRWVVAKKLGTSDEPVLLQDIQSQLETPWISDSRKPLTREQLKRQLAVLWAGHFAELKFYGEENLSATAMNTHKTAGAVAEVFADDLDMANIFGRFRRRELTEDEQKRVAEEAEKLSKEAATLAEEAIMPYPKERFEVLLQSDTKVPGKALNLEEMQQVLAEGKTLKDIRAQRRQQALRSFGNLPSWLKRD